MSAIGQKLSNYASSTQHNINRQFSDFQNTKYVSGTKDFLNSNSLVAKFAFLMLVVIVFVLVLRLTIQLLNYIFTPSHNPYIYEGLLDARDGPLTFSSNPNVDTSVPILRSDNQTQGLEFTWSIWILIKDLHTVNQGQKKHIFHKGAPITTGTTFPLTQSPGLWINEKTNTLEVMIDVYTDDKTSSTSFTETISIYDVPLNKWLNVMVRAQGNILDIFINGAITVRHKLSDVVRQNYGNTYLLEKGGFSGSVSNLRYFNYSLNVAEILDIVNAGPDLTTHGKASQIFPPYFALRWYFQGAGGGALPQKS